MSEDLMTKVQDLIENMINPAVAGHGGFVQLVDVKDNKVYLQMGGGCQGCGAADVTLKQGIERLIKESLPDAKVSIEDLRGDGDHYAAHVVSGAFRGKSRVQQHQLVYQALRGRMGNELHALALQTSAPED